MRKTFSDTNNIKGLLTILLVILFSPRLHAEAMEKSFYSPSLGIEKSYWIYLPPGYHKSSEKFPTLYLFRGHEREWFDGNADPHRRGNTIETIADELMTKGRIRKAIIIGVGMTSSDGRTTSLGMNMRRPDLGSQDGIGTGRFSDYFRNDLIPHIQSEYKASSEPADRSADGFSLGGFMVNYLAIKFPGLFASVGSYDATMMFPLLDDPTERGALDDLLWISDSGMFDATFGDHHDRDTLMAIYKSNPITLLEALTDSDLELLTNTRFWITAAAPADRGNHLRNYLYVQALARHGLKNHAPALGLSKTAVHNWFWADTHVRASLSFHLSKTITNLPSDKSRN